jgi:hypothetical protein
MTLFKNKLTLYIACGLNALMMMVVMFIWLNQYMILDDEVLLIKLTTGIKNHWLKLKEQPNPDEFLFIDLTWEKTLADEKNQDGQVIGKRPITDRTRIAQLLHSLNKNKDYKFIILDVFFKDSANYRDDSLLQAEFSQVKNLLIPYHKRDKDDQPDKPIFKAPLALSDYEQGNDQFIKYKIVQGNNFKTTPLVMYETLHPKDTLDRNGFIFHNMGKHISINSFILNLRIWWNDIENSKEVSGLSNDSIRANTDSTRVKYKKMYFTDLMAPGLPEVVYDDIIHGNTKGKILVIGAFDEGDMHETIYGQTPGPLILLNAYLAILHKDNLINWSFIIFLFIGFYFISYKCFSNKDFLEIFLKKAIKKKGIVSKIVSIAGYLLYFVLLSIISYFMFNIHLTVLVLSIYMEAVEFIRDFIEKRRANKSIVESLIGDDD